MARPWIGVTIGSRSSEVTFEEPYCGDAGSMYDGFLDIPFDPDQAQAIIGEGAWIWPVEDGPCERTRFPVAAGAKKRELATYGLRLRQ